MILALARRWAFVVREALVKFVDTDPSASRCSIKCCALKKNSAGLAMAEGGR